MSVKKEEDEASPRREVSVIGKKEEIGALFDLLGAYSSLTSIPSSVSHLRQHANTHRELTLPSAVVRWIVGHTWERAKRLEVTVTRVKQI